MIKYLITALVFGPNKSNDFYLKNDIVANGPPGIVDKEFDFVKQKWMQDRLTQLQSTRLSMIDKEEIAKEVLDLLDLDEVAKMSFNIIAGGLTSDWDFSHFDNQS
jgi:hypothetical protein